MLQRYRLINWLTHSNPTSGRLMSFVNDRVFKIRRAAPRINSFCTARLSHGNNAALGPIQRSFTVMYLHGAYDYKLHDCHEFLCC